MFTLETEEQRVPGPETGGGAELSSGNPMPWDLKGRDGSIATVEDPLTKKEKKRENLIFPIQLSHYSLHFRTLPPCKHKYPKQPTATSSK